jgi:cell division protein FtsI/penicillin-binding protein 2
MGSLAAQRIVWLFLIAFAAAPAFPQQSPKQSNSSHSLFSQSAAEILQREYGKSEISFVLLDAGSGALLASNWESADKPIPMGSLVKPFTALAYAETHNFLFPTLACKGKANRCWQDKPHGPLNLALAISVSCNAYFLQLAEAVSHESVVSVANSFDLDAPAKDATPANLIGLGDEWKIAPLRLARAYLELFRRKDAPGVSAILEGLRQSGLRGTGAAVDRQLKHSAALIKTGTALCTHSRWAPADGLVMALVPAEKPELLLFIRMHSVTGAKAAETAGLMLGDVEQ